jgi:CheY-like chemotaxis protein
MCQAVVVVDDDAVRGRLGELLREERFEVTAVNTALGAEALVRDLQPDVVFVDLALPYRSGASLLPALKSNLATATIPVVVVSTIADLLPPRYQALASSIIRNPADLNTLRQVIQDLPRDKGKRYVPAAVPSRA